MLLRWDGLLVHGERRVDVGRIARSDPDIELASLDSKVVAQCPQLELVVGD